MAVAVAVADPPVSRSSDERRSREAAGDGLPSLPPTMLRFGDFTIDPVAFELRRGGDLVPVQRRVFDVVAYLVSHPDRLVPKEELFERVWTDVAVSEASLAQAVKHARRALGDDADSPRYIVTVRGRGYRFVGPVEVVGERPVAAPRVAAVRRGSFVGRDAAMRCVEDALRDATEGRGGVVLVSGEPGIGKTRVLDELSELARAGGARTLLARCHEGDAGAPVLWPWIQILRLGAAFDPGGVTALARDNAGALPDLLPDIAPPPGAAEVDPLRARFRLFDATARWLAAASKAAPIVILLDDLHRADEPSLLMLRLLASSIREARVLVAGAHRSVRGERAEILGGLSREGACRQVLLEGLGDDDVGTMLALGLGASPPAALVRSVHAQTGGNPFFVTQIVHAAAARGGVPDEAELAALMLRSPAGEAIRAHLDILSAACRDLLSAAAVAGPAFDAGVLGAALEMPADEVIALLGEAADVGIVVADERRAGRYGFAHALVREARYAAIPLSRRVRLHGRIGAALIAQERAGVAPSFAEIAYHLLQAAPAGDAALAASYAVRAAEEAAARGSHEDAARSYERALEALDLGPADPMRRVDVMLALGNARFRAGDLARSKEVFQQSGNLARALGAGDKFAEAALGYALEDERTAVDRRRIAFLEEGLRAVTGGSATRRALLTGRLAVAQYFAADRAAREKLAREAVGAARASNDRAALAFALRCLHFVLLAPDTAEERSAVSGELVALTSMLDDREGELHALACRIGDRLELGRVAEVDADIAAYARLATELGQPAFQWSALLYRVGRALACGPVEQAAALLDEATLPGGSVRGPASGGLLVLLFLVRRAESRLAEIDDELRASVARAPERALRRALVALAALARGDGGAASRELAALTSDGLGAIRLDLDWLGTVACLVEIAAALGDRERSAMLHRALLPYAGRLVLAGHGAACIGPVSTFLGLSALASGDLDDAAHHLEQAVATSQALGAPPFVARAQRVLAEARRRRGDAGHADALMAEALDAARRLGLTDLAGSVVPERA